MSTNSTIAIERKDGTRTAIYCHWDGYIEHNGIILQVAYNTADKVEKLLELGDLSILGYYTDPKEGTTHNFENYQEDVCVAYHRDRGEDFVQSDGKQEFNYIFIEEDACWYVEREYFLKDTKAQKFLDLRLAVEYKRTRLLDEILYLIR